MMGEKNVITKRKKKNYYYVVKTATELIYNKIKIKKIMVVLKDGQTPFAGLPLASRPLVGCP